MSEIPAHLKSTVNLMIEAAVLEERRACAKIAYDKAIEYEDPTEADWNCSRPIAVRLRAVSLAIRRR